MNGNDMGCLESTNHFIDPLDEACMVARMYIDGAKEESGVISCNKTRKRASCEFKTVTVSCHNEVSWGPYSGREDELMRRTRIDW